jgi:tRNA-dihydrouridine synthase
VAGNGDIASAEDLIARAAGPCDAVMVGRAAVRQPWIFAQARGKDLFSKEITQRREGAKVDRGFTNSCENSAPLRLCERSFETILEETGLRFLELLGRWQPPEFHISRARRFFALFCDNLKWGNYVKNLLNREETLAGMERALRGYFRENPHPLSNTPLPAGDAPAASIQDAM